MTKGKYFIYDGAEGAIPVEGYTHSIQGVDFGFRKADGKWDATHLATGLLVCNKAKTKKESVKEVEKVMPKLKAKLEKGGYEKMLKAINDAKGEEKEETIMAKAKANEKQITVQMSVGKITKNTIRFEEVLESEYTSPKVGTIYVPKATLGELGYKEGNVLTVTVGIK